MKAHHPNSIFGRAKCRFTLIELLITVAVIAILAGMLLPALNAARMKAQTITCAGNMKQLGTAVFSYTGDNDDYMPSRLWPRETLIYIKPEVYSKISAKSKTAVFAPVYRCSSPIYSKNAADQNLNQLNYLVSGVFGSLPANSGDRLYFAYAPTAAGDTVSSAFHAKTGQVKAPSSKIYLTEDGMYKSNDMTYLGYAYALNQASPARVHGMNGNITRADGGVQSLRFPTLFKPDQYEYYLGGAAPDVDMFTVNRFPTKKF